MFSLSLTSFLALLWWCNLRRYESLLTSDCSNYHNALVFYYWRTGVSCLQTTPFNSNWKVLTFFLIASYQNEKKKYHLDSVLYVYLCLFFVDSGHTFNLRAFNFFKLLWSLVLVSPRLPWLIHQNHPPVVSPSFSTRHCHSVLSAALSLTSRDARVAGHITIVKIII